MLMLRNGHGSVESGEGTMRKKLIILNFRPETTKKELFDLLDDYGLESIVLTPGRYAVLTFKDQWAAEEAMRYLRGRKLVVLGHWFRLKLADR
jgi:hypothetical protein